MGGKWLACALLTAAAAVGQPALRIKPRGPRRPSLSQATAVKARSARRHFVVQFKHQPNAGQLADLTARGARIVQYIPDFAYVLSASDWAAPSDAAVAWSGILEPEDKLSAQLAASADPNLPNFALIEFYPDVDMSLARSVVLESQLLIQENPDLLDHHLLVSGTLDGIEALAQWDEVAYIFPASDDLVQGVPVNSCAGALTAQGQIGQSVAKVGGWAEPGNGAALSYAFRSITGQIPSDAAKAEIVRAFGEWAKYAKLTFNPTDDVNASRTLSVLFGSGSHGDAYPFQPSGPVLAHTFYPYPANSEPIAGDLHFNADENWQVGADVDLFSVALHETGHALGLGHSDQPGAVMYPYYRKVKALTQEDIGAILSLYPPQDGTAVANLPLALTVQDLGGTTSAPAIPLAGTTSGGSGTVRVTWAVAGGLSGVAAGSTNWSIAAAPLNLGANAITVTATDSQQSAVSQTVTVTRVQAPVASAPSTPALQILTPAGTGSYAATSGTIAVSGTASDTSGISRITWTTSQGTSGQASGTLNWTTGQIGLSSGATVITVTAWAQSGTSASQSIQVNYIQPVTPSAPITPVGGNPVNPPANPSGDTTPPSLAILSPAITSVSTSASSIAFNGTAKDNVGVASVTWITSNGDGGQASGTETWSVPAIPLLVGTTTVTIRAYDRAGNSGWRSVVVTRH